MCYAPWTLLHRLLVETPLCMLMGTTRCAEMCGQGDRDVGRWIWARSGVEAWLSMEVDIGAGAGSFMKMVRGMKCMDQP